MEFAWKEFSKEKPPQGLRLVIFRFSKEKATIAILQTLLDDEGKPKESWVTEHGTVHYIDPCDKWIKLPPISYTKEY